MEGKVRSMAGLDIEKPVEFAYRDNYLDFISKRKGTDTGIRLFTDNKGDLGCYTVKDYCVTDGQDPDKCIRDMDYYIVIVVYSSAVADIKLRKSALGGKESIRQHTTPTEVITDSTASTLL